MLKFILFTFTFTFTFISTFTYAATFTEQRIYLDENNRTTDFYITNDSNRAEVCEFKFTNVRYDKNGVVNTTLSDAQNNAFMDEFNSYVRYSPRNLELKPGSSQRVRFILKRKISKNKIEVRSNIDIRCVKEKVQGVAGQVAVSPVLVQRFPVIVRIGDLNASINVDNVIKNNRDISFELVRNGNRSVYGVLSGVNRAGETLFSTKGIAMYPESQRRQFNYTIPTNINSSSVIIKFVEDKRYGGTLEFSQEI